MADTLAVIPTYVRSEEEVSVSAKAIFSLRKTAPDVEILVVDDHSEDLDLVEKLEAACADAGVMFEYRPSNDGFAKTVNMGMRRARRSGQNVLLVNADVEFMDNGWYAAMQGNSADVVGALLVYPNGLVQHAGVYYSLITRRFDHIYRMAPRTLAQVSVPRTCPVTGALMLIRHETLNKLGVFDENFSMGFEDVDYCHMVFQAGMRCAYEPGAIAIHHESLFRQKNPTKQLVKRWDQSWQYLHEKHKGRGFADYVPTMIWDEE